MKVALDHRYSPAIAAQLRSREHDVIAAVERGWNELADEALLELCTSDGRVLLTNDVADLVVLVRRWSLEGRSHAGLVFTSDRSLPRGRRTIGRYVDALDGLMAANPADDAFTDRVHWL